MTSMQLSERLFTTPSAHTDELIDHLQQKKALLEAGDPSHEDIRTALIIGAGAMRGVYSGGVVIGLEELGMTEVFDDVIGISAGAATAAYFLSGQAELGTTIYYEELASKEFIDVKRRKNVLNVGYLEEVFTESKPLDQEAIRNNRSRFHIGVTNVDTAQPEYIEVAHDPNSDIIKLIQASSSVPGLTLPIRIEGTLYGDGITTCKNPIKYAVETLGATDVFCIVNQPLREKATAPVSDRLVSALLTRRYNEAIKVAYRDRHHMSDETAATTYSPDIHIGVLCPEGKPVGRLTTDAQKLTQVALKATLQTKALFE